MDYGVRAKVIKNKKILYLFDASDWESRMAVANAAQEDGAIVTVGLINGNNNDIDKAPEFKIVPLLKRGSSANVAASLRMLWDINRLIAKARPDIIHVVTLKYGFLTALAAMLNRKAHKVYTIAGLGYLFRSDDKKSRRLRTVLSPFLSFAFHRPNTTLIFQNPDDLGLLIKKGIALLERSSLIKGSGVYLDRFKPNAAPSLGVDKAPIVLMPTRLVHEKGIAVFVDAARILKQKGVNALFQIAGGETDNPNAISREEMIEMTKDGAVQWLGRVENMPELLSQASLIAYPSYYGEGVPRVLLEACAAGRAIVTTDHPGCRETVDPHENGVLVPVKDPKATARAIEEVLNNPDIRVSMGKKSREKAEDEFDIHKIVEQTLSVYSGY